MLGRTSGRRTAKSISIKGQGCRSGRAAGKAPAPASGTAPSLGSRPACRRRWPPCPRAPRDRRDRRPAGGAPARADPRARQGLCRRGLRHDLPRHQPQPLAPLVHHGGLRQPRQGALSPRAHAVGGVAAPDPRATPSSPDTGASIAQPGTTTRLTAGRLGISRVAGAAWLACTIFARISAARTWARLASSARPVCISSAA